jgi:hypothetical protein
MNLSDDRDDNGDPCTRGWTKEFSLRPFRSQTVPQPATIRFNRGGPPWPLSNLILALHPYGVSMAWTCSKVCASCYSACCPCCYRSQSDRYCGQRSRRFEAKVCCPECPFVTSVSGQGPHPLQDPSVENAFSGVLHPGHGLRGSVNRHHRRNCRRLPAQLSCFTNCTTPHGITKTLRSLAEVGQRSLS